MCQVAKICFLDQHALFLGKLLQGLAQLRGFLAQGDNVDLIWFCLWSPW